MEKSKLTQTAMRTMGWNAMQVRNFTPFAQNVSIVLTLLSCIQLKIVIIHL